MNTQEYYEQVSGWTQDRADESLERTYRAIYTEQVIDLVSWNFARLDCQNNAIAELEDNGEIFNESNQAIGSCFLGTVFSIMPSGKYWTFWADSNVDRIEQIKDRAFFAALENEANSHDMWIENSEYDPCDLLACCWVDISEG